MEDIEDRDESYGQEVFVTRYRKDFGWVPDDYTRWVNFLSELEWCAVYEDGKPVKHVKAIVWKDLEAKATEQNLYHWPAELIGQ